MLRTRFSQLLGIDHPVVSAPMALHSGGMLAGAVSAAGGLGTFGGIHPARGPDWLHAEIATVRKATERPFGVGFITAFLPHFESLFDAALAERPDVISLSFGYPGRWAERVKRAGALLMCQVQTHADADAAVQAGADVLVAQGAESGGHSGAMGLLPFLSALVARYPSLPILAAGGISDGRSLAAVLTAGADGVWVGTSFLATTEAVEVHQVHKDLIVASDGGDTVWTRAYDIPSPLPWPDGIGDRVRRNHYTEQWDGRDAELRAQPRPEGTPDWDAPPDPDVDPIRYGQGAGSVEAVRPAADVLRDLCADAEAILRQRPGSLLTG
jgi:nitronate monooxygenase